MRSILYLPKMEIIGTQMKMEEAHFVLGGSSTQPLSKVPVIVGFVAQ